MANIKNELNNIKSALYGKDVRGSIHDGIDAINKEVENTTGRQVDLESTFDQLVINAGNSNAEIVDARVKNDGTSYSKLGDRLDAVDSQLAHIKNFSTPEMFGAIGDGIADDTYAIQQAINNSNTVIFRGDKSYNISQIIIKKDCIIEGNGATINQISENECIISQGNYKTVTTLTNNAERYKDVITLSSYDNISVGDILVMKSNKLWYHDNRDSLYKGETHKVVKVSSDGITIEPSLQDSYDITTETVECSFFTPITVDINNLNIIGNMYIKQNINTVVKNCRVKPVNKSNAICLSSSYNTTFDNCVITDCNISDTGYAIQDNSSTYTKVLNCKFNNNRRGVDFSGIIPSRLGLVENCTVSNPVEVIDTINTSAFGTHGPADSIIFRNNNITNCRQAFVIRGSYCVIENNILYGRIQFGVTFTAGDNIVIRGNKYFSQDNNKDKIDASLDTWTYLSILLYVGHNPTLITIEDNHFEALRGALVLLNDNVDKLIIRRNSVDKYVFKNGFTVIDGTVSSNIENLEYTYNNLNFTSSKYQIMSENISYNINKLICTDFPISPSLIVWIGSGTVTDNGTDLRITILPCAKKDYLSKNVNLVGTLMFTVEGSEVALNLYPLVYSRITSEAFLYISQNYSQGVLKFLQSDRLYISSNTENYNGKFSVGSHAIDINISYLR